MNTTILLAALLLAATPTGEEPVIGGRCEGCEAVFAGMPDELTAEARLAPPDEPGEPMRIEGTVLRPDGEPAPGIIVYAYQTDAHGVYPPNEWPEGSWAHRHGRLRAWAQSDAEGRYAFETIRPASYPDSRVPAHVHMHLVEPGCCTYYLDSIEFTDDPHLAGGAHEGGRGGPGVVDPVRAEDGTWLVRRDIFLGQGVPGYERRH